MTDPATLAGLLAAHQPVSPRWCGCGWEGDRYAAHLHDVLLGHGRVVAETLVDAGILAPAAYFNRAMLDEEIDEAQAAVDRSAGAERERAEARLAELVEARDARTVTLYRIATEEEAPDA